MAKRKASKEQIEAKKQRISQLQKQLKALIPEQRQAFADKVGAVVTIEGHPLSLCNTILCMMQKGDVSIVGGYRQWQRANRHVCKGQHGLIIWIPAGQKEDPNKQEGEISSDDLESMRFFTATVFDISQTEENVEEATD